MRKLIFTIGILLLGQSVFATQARLIALGLDELDNDGSYYIKDSRNIFINPSFIHDYKNIFIGELGDSGYATSSNGSIDQDSNPKAQGGFLKSHGDYVWGAYLGNESTTSSFLRIASSSAAATLNKIGLGAANVQPKGMNTADNQVDLFFGGKAAVDWGVNFIIVQNKDEVETTKFDGKAYAVRIGAKDKKWDAHFNLSLKNTADKTDITDPNADSTFTTVNYKFDGKFGIYLGGSYLLSNENRIYGYAKSFKWDQTDDYNYTTDPESVRAITSLSTMGKTGTSEGEFLQTVLGFGRTETFGSGNVFVNVYMKKLEVELNLTEKAEISLTKIPLTLGYEVKANDWLKLRGSVTQYLYGKKDHKNFNTLNSTAKVLIEGVYGSEGKGTLPNTTRVHAGATLTFGTLEVDGVIGTTSNSRTGSSSSSSKTQNGVLSLDNFMTRAALTYRF